MHNSLSAEVLVRAGALLPHGGVGGVLLGGQEDRGAHGALPASHRCGSRTMVWCASLRQLSIVQQSVDKEEMLWCNWTPLLDDAAPDADCPFVRRPAHQGKQGGI